MALVGTMVVLVVAFVFVATSSDWGQSRVRGLIESTVRDRLVAGSKFRIARLWRDHGSTWIADSVVLIGPDGRQVASIRRASIEIALVSVLRGDIRLGTLGIDGAQIWIERGRDGKWNTSNLLVKRPDIPLDPRPKRRIIADSVEVRDSRLDLLMADASPREPAKHRVFDKLHLAGGKATLLDADGSGHLPFSTLGAVIDDPPVTLVTAIGAVSWWSDSLQLNVPRFRLPASRASVTGTIGWRDGTRLALDIVADSISVADIRWISALVPSEGDARATVAVRSAPGGQFRYEINEFDLKAFKSHLVGRFHVTPGELTDVRGLQLAMQPLDLALVRNVFGDTILKPTWQGAIDGTLTARGGKLNNFVIDSVVGRYIDARIGGAQSRFAATGAMNIAGQSTQLLGMRVRIDSLDVHTLGAIAHAADSLPGALKGSLILDGPTKDLNFTELRMRHVNGSKATSAVRGFGRIASDTKTHWLDATLTLDTVAIATFAPDSLTIPLHGTVGGTLVLGATADTMTIDARLKAGEATTHLTGSTLLDSLRTRLDLRGTIAGLDARNFVARKDIPAHSLSGAVRISLDLSERHEERHLELQLDSTSRIGKSRISSATIRFGSDSAGIHLDTADVRTDTWRVEAKGALAAKGYSTTDSITFATEIDSLGALESILLDSTGAPMLDSLAGRIRTRQGVIKGSFEHATLTTDLGAMNVVVGATSVAQATGSAQIANLPDSATGFFRGTINGLVNGKIVIDTAQLRADVFEGKRARVSARVARGDSIDVTFGAEVTWPDSTYTVKLDSLDAQFRGHHWRLELPANARVDKNVIAVDSLVLKSDHDAFIVAAGRVPQRGEMDARVNVRRLGFDELAFLGLLPADMTGMVSAEATIKGTRDAPVLAAKATLDSIQTEGTARPSVKFDGTYANKKATVALTALAGNRTVLEAKGDVPIDLTLRTVDDRLIDAPMALQLKSDSTSLKLFDGLLPRVTGLGGDLTADVQVGGTVRRPRGTGSLRLTGGSLDVQRYGISIRAANADIQLSGDSVLVKSLRVSDGDSPQDTIGISGAVHLAGRRWTEWGAKMRSTAHNFRVIDDPRTATAQVSWNLDIEGRLQAARVTGEVDIPYGVYTIGPQRRQRALFYLADSLARAEAAAGIPNVDGVLVFLGNDVRLKSRDANVQLTGSVELFGAMNDPWLSGAITATRGTYRVTVGPIKRSFRVDSGSVILEGTKDIPAALNLYASYLVRQPDQDDITIRAHVYGMTDGPRLDLTSDLGSATSQSEIISYLVFGKSTFGLEQASNRDAATTTATAALLPTLGGFLEATLGTVLPFFSTLQVTSTAGDKSFSSVKQNPIEGLLNSYAVTGGRQVGSDSFFSLSTGRCSASSVAGTGSAQFWFGAMADYRPKRTIGASVSVDPGPAPCNRVAAEGSNYQFGIDLSYDWKFGKKR